jgi:glycosyltransferase involved in cell wall biosynthesis
MKPVRIALVSDAVLPFNKGGKETRIYHLTREMVKLGYHVDIYTMRWWGKGNTFNAEGITYHALCRKYPLYSGSRRSVIEAIIFGLSTFKMFFYQFDILEVDHMPFFQLFSAKIVSLVRRKPLYATWHEVWGLIYWRQYLGHIKGTVAYGIERLSVLMPDHIVAVSNQTLIQVRQSLHYKGSLSLVSNGIDYQHINLVKAAPTKTDIIYAGRLLPHKNVDLLIGAVAELKKSHPKIQCLIIGEGPELGKLQALVSDLQLTANVKLQGFLESSDDVLAAMKASRVFVLPSSREGFGISILEAYACGLQVVTADCPENAGRHLVSTGVGIATQLNVHDIASAIDTFLSGKPKVSISKKSARQYNWQESASALVEAYAL